MDKCEINDGPRNTTPLIYSHFNYGKREQLRKELENIFNILGIDNEIGMRDFILAEMVDNFIVTIYNTKKATERLGYNPVNDDTDNYREKDI